MPGFGVISPLDCQTHVVSIQNEGAREIHITFGGRVQRGADRQRVPPVVAIAGMGLRLGAWGQEFTPLDGICRPSGAFVGGGLKTWGSRPRLNICRASGAQFEHAVEGPQGAARRVTKAQPQRHREHKEGHGESFSRSVGELVEMQLRATLLSPSATFEIPPCFSLYLCGGSCRSN